MNRGCKLVAAIHRGCPETKKSDSKKNKMPHKKIAAFLLVLSLTACTEDFSDLNTNPNAPTDVQPEFLLRQVLWDYAEQMSFEGFVAGNLLGQYFTAVDFNLFDRHALNEPQFGGNPWDVLYPNLRDAQLILDMSRSNPNLAVYEGPALVLKAYIAGVITDLFGDVPYREAVAGKSGTVTPAYDPQEEIYLGAGGILDNLEKAVEVMENYAGAIPLRGDILYAGDLRGWIRFANSLRIKQLMRISGREAVGAELRAIYESGEYIQTNAQNAAFDFSDTPPNSFRMATARTGDFNIYVMSLTAEEILAEPADPRRAVLFRPAGNTGEYKGLINGIDASQTSIVVEDFARPGTLFRERTGDLDANYLTAWETNFFLAEAAERGLIDADVRELYRTAVAQAFDYWQTELPADYLERPGVRLGVDGSGNLPQIHTQKWIALLGQGYEGWIEYRRTGFPELKPVAASLNNGVYPVRFPYPTDEQALNLLNYQSAADATDGNSPNARVWWDVE